MLTARLLATAPAQTHDRVILDYDARLIRRRRLETVAGVSFLVDLESLINLDDHWGFELSDGTCVAVSAAAEDLVEITGDLARLAWHIGNRHTPCQIEPARLVIRRDHVIEGMLRKQGASLRVIREAFTPEGGAYGHGRTMGHSHGPEAGHGDGPAQGDHHGHGHGHQHGHGHPHGHGHHHPHSHSHD